MEKNNNRLIFYVVTVVATLVIYWRFSEVELIEDAFMRSNLMWILAAVIIQVVSYFFNALNVQEVLRVKDTEVGIKEIFPITFVIQFLNQALPSGGVSGQGFFVQYLKKKFNLPVAEGVGRAILELVTLYMAFGAFFIISALLMIWSGVFGRHPEIRYLIYGFSFFAAVAVFTFLISQKKKRGKVARWIIDKLHDRFEKRKHKKDESTELVVQSDRTNHVAMIFEQFKNVLSIETLSKHKKSFWMAFFWQAMILLANVITLYFISFAIDTRIGFSVAFIAFTLTKFLSMISFIPGALGVFEGGMTLILISLQVPAAPAFAMTLLLRAFTFWLPMPVGWFLYHRYLNKPNGESAVA
jgi:uncharacterized protein (TIRG00374 family)